MASDWPSKSEIYGTFNTLSDRLDNLDTHVDAGVPGEGTVVPASFGLQPALWIFNIVDQSIPNNTWTTIEFTTSFADIFSQHSTSVNPSRIYYKPAPGLFQATVEVAWANNAVGVRGVRFLQDGIAVATHHDVALTMPVGQFQNCQCTMQPGGFTEETYYEIQVYQNSGGALNCVADGFQAPSLMAAYLCPLPAP